MKINWVIILLILCVKLSFGQNVDYDLIKYNGLNFISTKSEIEEKLGIPNNTFQPNYECGFLSSAEQGKNYFTLEYDKVKFTGNGEKYILEQINFENDNSIVLDYGEYKLSCETKLNELAEIFGNEILSHFENDLNDEILIYHAKYDGGIILELKNGKLIRFEYWSPC